MLSSVCATLTPIQLVTASTAYWCQCWGVEYA